MQQAAALDGRPSMTEKRATLEREILRLRESIAASKAALRAQSSSVTDRAWLMKQLDLRQRRLRRLSSGLMQHGLNEAMGSKNQRTPKARPKRNSRGKGSGERG